MRTIQWSGEVFTRSIQKNFKDLKNKKCKKGLRFLKINKKL